jgi:DNA invertase Pin-like site-specific DNA recombinase
MPIKRDEIRATIAYLRVSTNRQDLENQRLEIQNYAKAKGLSIDEFIKFRITSRRRTKDRGIDELLQKLRKGDILIVSELSRLARSMREVHNICYEIEKKKVELHVIKQNLILGNGNSNLATKIYINAFAMAAEIERDLISQRTKNGLARAKASGKKLGNPNLKPIHDKLIKRADDYAAKLKPTLKSFIAEGLSQRQIVDRLNQIDCKTPRGKEFKLINLQNLLKRLNLKTKHTATIKRSK